MADILRLATFNVLAPQWVGESHYPPPARPFLPVAARREKIIALLKAWAQATDVIALQETSERELAQYRGALAGGFDIFTAYHAPHYWAGWLNGNRWEPNGTALFIRKGVFEGAAFQDIPLSGSGNHAGFFSGTHKATGTPVRLACVHLDSDDATVREAELGCLLDLLPGKSGTADIVMGDFNFDVGSHAPSKAAGFASLLPELGLPAFTSMPRYAGHDNGGRLDHILFRHAAAVKGEVFDAGILHNFPEPAQDDARLAASLRDIGSDHFPVLGAVSLK